MFDIILDDNLEDDEPWVSPTADKHLRCTVNKDVS